MSPAAEPSRDRTAPGGALAGVVLAAGEGSRLGSPKQLVSLAGRPLLEYPLAVLAAAPLRRRFVVLGFEADRILEGVNLHGCEPVVCERWREGLARSLACGIEAAAESEAVAVLVGDQPGVSVAAVERVLGARGAPALAVRATYGGRPGHPVVLERALFEDAMELSGDAGASSLFERGGDRLREVPCDDVASGHDVDTAEDLERVAAAGPPSIAESTTEGR